MINSFFRPGLNRGMLLTPRQGFMPGAQQLALCHDMATAQHSYSSTQTYAFKGAQIKPLQQGMRLWGVSARFEALASGATYQGMLTTVDGSNNINWMKKTNKYTLAAASYTTGIFKFFFANPILLLKDTIYQLMVGRTDGADNYTLTLQWYASLAYQPSMCQYMAVGTARCQKANPAVGDAMTINASATTSDMLVPIAEFEIL